MFITINVHVTCNFTSLLMAARSILPGSTLVTFSYKIRAIISLVNVVANFSVGHEIFLPTFGWDAKVFWKYKISPPPSRYFMTGP